MVPLSPLSRDCYHQTAFAVEAIDTVAAGDAFNGGLASPWRKAKLLEAAGLFASAVAACSVTQKGGTSLNADQGGR